MGGGVGGGLGEGPAGGRVGGQGDEVAALCLQTVAAVRSLHYYGPHCAPGLCRRRLSSITTRACLS